MRNTALTIAIILGVLLTGCKGERGDTEITAPVIDATVEPDHFITFSNTHPDAAGQSQISSVAYAEAYYQTVDPDDERTTLEAWKTVNGFDPATAVHATFRDTKDVGYGRDMYAWQDNGNTYIYVDNYIVELEPGDATAYGPLNLDAAINQDRRYQIGTNAIEFSPGPEGHRIAKFFTFAPGDAGGDQPRVTSADLDGRGVKHMPAMCVVCHGGTLYPLTTEGAFNPISLKSPKMHFLEQDTFQFSPLAGFTRADQEGNIAEINRMINDTFVEAGGREDKDQDLAAVPPLAADQANWDSDFAQELLEIAYGGDLINPTAYNANAIPAGWVQTPDRPDGVETLYRRVIAPHCIGCHSLRGTQAAGDNHNAVNFSSYEQFKSVNDQNIDLVYRRGTMPRSLINFDQFWDDPDDLPALLASYLEGFDVFDTAGRIARPGRAVAIPGADRTVTSPAILDATASLFSTSYAWSVVSSTDPAAALDDPSSPAPELTATDSAVVVLELTTANANGDSEPVQVTITVDNSLTPATFVNDIMSIDGTAGVFGTGNANCNRCHQSGNTPVVPVYFDKDDYTGNEQALYRNVLDRVDLNDPENSVLLREAIGDQHGGGKQLDLSTPSGKENYNTLLNWIRNGAPCGTHPDYC